eukprot:s4844_g8.t1
METVSSGHGSWIYIAGAAATSQCTKSFVGDAVSPLLLKDLLALAPEVVVPGDGYGGRARPFKPDEVWAGVQLLDAADWAVRQAQEGRREAMAFARSFVEVLR